LRKLNEMFHIDGEQLVKSSNGQPVPPGEPLFILRARDVAAAPAIWNYIALCAMAGTPPDRIEQLRKVYHDFVQYRVGAVVKVPGSTHGA
jgi:hypothetical protein